MFLDPYKHSKFQLNPITGTISKAPIKFCPKYTIKRMNIESKINGEFLSYGSEI